jgi:hypothetical protein
MAGVLEDIDKPTLTEDGLYRYLKHEEGLPVTRYLIKCAVMRRELVPVRLGHGNYFSRRDGLTWIESRRTPGPYRVPKAQLAE